MASLNRCVLGCFGFFKVSTVVRSEKVTNKPCSKHLRDLVVSLIFLLLVKWNDLNLGDLT